MRYPSFFAWKFRTVFASRNDRGKLCRSRLAQRVGLDLALLHHDQGAHHQLATGLIASLPAAHQAEAPLQVAPKLLELLPGIPGGHLLTSLVGTGGSRPRPERKKRIAWTQAFLNARQPTLPRCQTFTKRQDIHIKFLSLI